MTNSLIIRGISLFERIHQPNLPLVHTPESRVQLGAELAHTALALLQRLAGGAASEYTIQTESSHLIDRIGDNHEHPSLERRTTKREETREVPDGQQT